MFSWSNPVYDRNVALMGAGDLQHRFDQANTAYGQALQAQNPNQGGGLVPGTAVGDGPAFPMVTGDPGAPGVGPAFPAQGPVGSVAPNNPPSGPTTIQDRPLPQSAGSFTPNKLPVQPLQADYDRLMGLMDQYKQNNQEAYSRQMGGGYSGGAVPSDMRQRFADGGQFRANPTSGVRPENAFAQESASYGQPGRATGASYGAGNAFGGVGPFDIQNPYAPR